MKTFYTALNYEQNLVHFAVSATVKIQGTLILFPPIVMIYLGVTIAILPGIISSFCMACHYCPKRRRRQRFERMEKLSVQLEKQEEVLESFGIDW